MTWNNPKLHLVNMNVYIKFGEILSICSQDIEQKRYFGVNQGPSADPERGGRGGGTGGLDPHWKITSYMGFYRE